MPPEASALQPRRRQLVVELIELEMVNSRAESAGEWHDPKDRSILLNRRRHPATQRIVHHLLEGLSSSRACSLSESAMSSSRVSVILMQTS